MKLQLGYLAANVLADYDLRMSRTFVYFEIDDFDYRTAAESRLPFVEVYRYSDKTLVASLTKEQNMANGFYTGLLTDYDRKSMYFKIIAPTVRLTMTQLFKI